MKNSQQKEKLWLEVKRKCHLNDNEISMAKELGLNPVKLIKNIPSKSQPWKLPVREWLHEIYEKHQTKIEKEKPEEQRTKIEYSYRYIVKKPRPEKGAAEKKT